MLAILLATASSPAAAQVAGKLSLQSGYEVRGYSVSRGRPVGVLDFSYDDSSGFYLSQSTFGALPDHDDPGLLGLIGDAGYARRLNSQLSIDGGIDHSEYIYAGSQHLHFGYTEIYAGLSLPHLSAHLSYSPAYFRSGAKTLYGEVEGNMGAFAGVRLNAHLGFLGYLAQPNSGGARGQYDWRFGASRQFGAFDLRAAVSGGGPDPDPYVQPRHSKTAITVGAGYSF